MSDYKPKVGESFQVLNKAMVTPAWEQATALYIGKHKILYDSESCSERCGDWDECEFRPIPTKADIEFDELIEILHSHFKNGFNKVAQHLQAAGFTKSKEVEKVDWNYLHDTLMGFNFNIAFHHNVTPEQWWEIEGKALLGHLIKNAPEDK